MIVLYSIYFYRIYETKKEIDLGFLEKDLPRRHTPSRTRFLRLRPKSILIDNPPLLINLGPVAASSGDIELSFQVQARLYDIGAISICLIYDNFDNSQNLESAALAYAGQKNLNNIFADQICLLQNLVLQDLGSLDIDTQFYEDYTIYRVVDASQVDDPVVLLMGEKTDFSPQMREQVLRSRLAYTQTDYALLTWDSALICDPEDPSDLRDLIEFANVQLLELRYYDDLLGKQMEAMYDDIEKAATRSSFTRLRRYRRIMSALMEFIADISEVAEKIDNLIKITEDVFYARVYQTTLQVLRIDQWRESVNRKLSIIQQNYSLLSNEVNVQHSNVLEWIIIILIALEFIFALWEALI